MPAIEESDSGPITPSPAGDLLRSWATAAAEAATTLTTAQLRAHRTIGLDVLGRSRPPD